MSRALSQAAPRSQGFFAWLHPWLDNPTQDTSELEIGDLGSGNNTQIVAARTGLGDGRRVESHATYAQQPAAFIGERVARAVRAQGCLGDTASSSSSGERSR